MENRLEQTSVLAGFDARRKRQVFHNRLQHIMFTYVNASMTFADPGVYERKHEIASR
ncbi:hypothetical protein P8935_14685 [Telmatobacter sp. DSM 110680]|uniref:Uncharacterized protein n=1 Tax=Telmatobacter sp. DSM 110680 TaxID=3036704 RepID=A0AAU7DFF6_9BACT